MAGNKTYYNDITWVKVLATLFITWFHFKWTAPEALAPIFIGGAIGNALFFYASGYLLRFREERYLGEWMIQKILRLLPSVWVFLAVTLFFGNNLSRNWHFWVYPTPFWFINNILVYFLILWITNNASQLVLKKYGLNGAWIAGLGTVICIIYLYHYLAHEEHQVMHMDEGYLKCWYFLLFMLWGYWDQIHKRTYSGSWKSMLSLIGAIALFFLYKKVGAHYEILVWAQFIFIPMLLVPVVYFGRCTASWLANIEISEPAKRGVSLVSNLTLDLYIVQVFIINHLMPTMPFPVNMCVCLVVIAIVGLTNNKLAGLVSRGLSRLLNV